MQSSLMFMYACICLKIVYWMNFEHSNVNIQVYGHPSSQSSFYAGLYPKINSQTVLIFLIVVDKIRKCNVLTKNYNPFIVIVTFRHKLPVAPCP